MDDSVSASSATLSKLATELRVVCVTATEPMRRHRGQQGGGKRVFIEIDESSYRLKI